MHVDLSPTKQFVRLVWWECADGAEWKEKQETDFTKALELIRALCSPEEIRAVEMTKP